ncbi:MULTISPECIES: prepilin-type N-terminal cleavage/methylation domain-containing protein [unclassified Cyanobium]|uniref:prepilin-type N-terminal cleavage/methylation domain-containing protein n=1 Tax=unclassified Cyanobium TaxID=2627006 RepID=UPI0020CE6D1D|nr:MULTISPECIES: prepilin-type N-terminal cleavage/methylation domain-containing protein [unclassified Cyanobium]MCP9776999.1 prepilin-type N-terminal cleavage/methylation domain-containing protein [Cyanobium sp. Tous-M-B4]MCP9875265.1 prepilin-type N-terminal cleavage/methylation domain-containing protein [Cyanobium sp. A2C-AMD]
MTIDMTYVALKGSCRPFLDLLWMPSWRRSRVSAVSSSPSNFLEKVAKASSSGAGFTFVEVLMTVVIVAVAAVAAAVSTNVAVRFSNKALDSTRIDSLIDRDIASLERASFQYTYCTGTYKWDSSPCGSAAPGSQNYYFPLATPSSSANAVNFGAACTGGTMTNSLTDAINGGDSTLALSPSATALGISREVTLDSASAHRLLIEYRLNNSVKRQRAVVPAAAYWCPDTEPLL